MSYDNPVAFHHIERAILIEDIPLPVYNHKHKLKIPFFETPDIEYQLAYNELKNVDAKFYIPILMTTFENNQTEIKVDKAAPKKTGFKGNIQALPYNTTNYTKLTIPKYILLQFIDLKNETEGSKDNYIPKGTEFLVACVGGQMDIDNMRIIGLYTLSYPKKNFPNLVDNYYGGNPVV